MQICQSVTFENCVGFMYVCVHYAQQTCDKFG